MPLRYRLLLRFVLTKRGHTVTDPACSAYRAPREGSWLDAVSRGYACLACSRRRRRLAGLG